MRISCIIFLLSVIAVISLAAEVSPLEDIFTCPPIAPQVNPTDVRRLRPTDIKVVMAAGDSMTAGLFVVKWVTALSSFTFVFQCHAGQGMDIFCNVWMERPCAQYWRRCGCNHSSKLFEEVGNKEFARSFSRKRSLLFAETEKKKNSYWTMLLFV